MTDPREVRLDRINPAPQIHNPPPEKPVVRRLTSRQVGVIGGVIVDLVLAQIALALGGFNIFGFRPFDFLSDWGQRVQQRAFDAYRNSFVLVDARAGNDPGTTTEGTLNDVYFAAVATNTDAVDGAENAATAQLFAEGVDTKAQTTIDGVWQGTQGGSSTGNAASTVVNNLRLSWARLFDGLGETENSTSKLPSDVASAANALRADASDALTNADTAQGTADLAQSAADRVITSGSNLCPNPSFEDTTLPIENVWAYTTAEKRSGSRSVMITTDGVNTRWLPIISTSSALYGEVFVEEGEVYSFEAFVRGASGNTYAGSGLSIRLGIWNGSTWSYPDVATLPNASHCTNTWVKLSGRYTIPAGAQRMRVHLQAHLSMAANQTYYWDDVAVREVTLASAADSKAVAAQADLGRASRDFTNLVAGSDFEGDTHPWNLTGLPAWSVATDQANPPGSKSLKVTAHTGYQVPTLRTLIEAKPGERFWIEFMVRKDSNYGPGGGNDDHKLRIGNQTGALVDQITIRSQDIPTANTWTKRSRELLVPAGATALQIQFSSHTMTGNLWIDDIVIRRLTRSEEIAPNAVTEAKIADNAVTGAKTSNLDGGRITTGTVPEVRVENLPATRTTANTANTRSQTTVDGVWQGTQGGSSTGNAAETVATNLRLSWARLFDGLGFTTGSTSRLPSDVQTAADALRVDASDALENAGTAQTTADIAFSTVGQVAASSNMVQSPGFEDATVSRFPYTNNRTAMTYETAQAKSGSRSLMWTNGPTTSTWTGLVLAPASNVRFYDVREGETIAASAWVLRHGSNNNTAGQVRLFMRFTNNGSSSSDAWNGNHTVNNANMGSGWFEMTNMGTCPAGRNRLEVMLINDPSTPVGNRYYVDDVVVREISLTQNAIDGIHQATQGGSATLRSASSVKDNIMYAWAKLFDGLGETSGSTLKLPTDVETVADALKTTATDAFDNAGTAQTTANLAQTSLDVRSKDFENLVAGSDWEGATIPWPVNSHAWCSIDTNEKRTGSASLRIVGGAAASTMNFDNGRRFDGRPGEKFLLELWAKRSANYANTNASDPRFRIVRGNGPQNGTTIADIRLNNSSQISATEWTRFTVTATMPNDANSFYFAFTGPATGSITAGNIWVDDIVVRRVVQQSEVDGLPELPVAQTLDEHSREIAQLKTSQDAAQSAGKTITVNFATQADVNELPAASGSVPYTNPPQRWTVTYTATSGSSATWGAQAGRARWRGTLSGSRTARVIYRGNGVTGNEKTLTDYQTLRGVLADVPGIGLATPGPWFTGIARVSDAGTAYVWARARAQYTFPQLVNVTGEIGCTLSNGSEQIWVSNIPLTWSTEMTLRCGVDGNPRSYQVFSGTKLVVSYNEGYSNLAAFPANPSLNSTGLGTNVVGRTGRIFVANNTGTRYTWNGSTYVTTSTGASGLGADHRRWGAIVSHEGSLTSGTVSSVSVADSPPIERPGAVARMWRTSTGNVSQPAGLVPIPANFWNDNWESAVIDATPSTGIFEVKKSGMYLINAAVQGASFLRLQTSTTSAFSTVTSLGLIFGGGAITEYLEAGTFVRLATSGSAVTITGVNDGGYSTYFQITGISVV